jgi:hypothetical protein
MVVEELLVDEMEIVVVSKEMGVDTSRGEEAVDFVVVVSQHMYMGVNPVRDDGHHFHQDDFLDVLAVGGVVFVDEIKDVSR